ncbi:MAG TPA: MBL fold metallo-hydrolase [Candidatus Tectomicrobia bacterium]|nr:MBL fold metallo-hydrolase [Candidatus Tectomicrobia bacterium]
MATLTIGAATVTRIEETYEPNFEARTFFPDWRPEVADEHRAWMVPDHYDAASGFLALSVHSWLVRVGGRTVLIDACVGNHKPRPLRPKWHLMETRYLDRLAAAGVRPEEVDVVLCTHLHMDHVGWFTRLDGGRWVPTFPNARHVFSRADYDHYLALDRDPARGPVNQGSFRDSVLPVVEAGLADMIAEPHALDEHLRIDPAPGHTPGTVVITLASRGATALFCGDILHHAVQIYHPEWNSFACGDAEGARASRRMVLERCAGSGALLVPAHFGAPFVCRIDATGEGFVPRW